MNYTVFEPSILWISENEWNDSKIRDDFIDHLLNNLGFIHDYKITKIYWTESLEESLWTSQLPPWRLDRDWRLKIVPQLNRLFSKNIEYINDMENTCEVEPNLCCSFNKDDIINNFLKLMHRVIINRQEIYLCLGLENQKDTYNFYCKCHNLKCKPQLIKRASEWFSYVDLLKDYWPRDIKDTYLLKEAISIYGRVNFNNDNYKYVYEFSDHFMKDIINTCHQKDRILYSICKRLLHNQKFASQNQGLRDEKVKGKDERRFRITDEKRIHYKYIEQGKIFFLRYYKDGEHDDGL